MTSPNDFTIAVGHMGLRNRWKTKLERQSFRWDCFFSRTYRATLIAVFQGERPGRNMQVGTLSVTEGGLSEATLPVIEGAKRSSMLQRPPFPVLAVVTQSSEGPDS